MMNIWVSVAIIAGLLVVGGIALVNALSTPTESNTQTIECTSCGNSCTAERNCGLSSCRAVSGGSCGCGN